MNESDEQRLMTVALEEVTGGAKRPDLRERILQRIESGEELSEAEPVVVSRPLWRWGAEVAAAAGVVAALVWLLGGFSGEVAVNAPQVVTPPDATVKLIPRLLKDIMPGRTGGRIGLGIDSAALGQRFFFAATAGKLGAELWASDGTEKGTVLLKDLNPGPEGSFPESFTRVGDVIFFKASTNKTGMELWLTDGTAEGTRLVKDIRPEGDSDPQLLTAFRKRIYFTADNGVHGRELWRSDGTAAGTELFRESQKRPRSFMVEELVATEHKLIFNGAGGKGSNYVLSSDGTMDEESVQIVFSSAQAKIEPGARPPSSFTLAGGLVFFAGWKTSSGQELWCTDGTEKGTRLVRDIAPGAVGSKPQNLIAVGHELFFTAEDKTHGRELWRTDGTREGTELVRDINPGNVGSVIAAQAVLDGILYLTVKRDEIVELWKSDGSKEGTQLVAEIDRPLHRMFLYLKGGWEHQLTAAHGAIYFIASEKPGLRMVWRRLWRSDGTREGTGPITKSFEINVYHLKSIDGRLLMMAYDKKHGFEYWIMAPDDSD